VVDEVLAVGDASFQKKCLGKMQGVASGGRTVLFVSHNMAAIARLCNRAILLSRGRVAADGAVATVIGTYLGGAVGESPTEVDFERRGGVPGNSEVRLLAARLQSDGIDDGVIDIRRPIQIELDYEVLREHYVFHPNIHIFNDEGTCVLVTNDSYLPETRCSRPIGRYRAVVSIAGNFFSEGLYSMDVAISTMDPVRVHVVERGLLAFHIHDPAEGDSARGTYGGGYPGVVRPILPWTTEPISTVDTRTKEGGAA
jgi:lipopolysaccharide transport system ATP-binding protein